MIPENLKKQIEEKYPLITNHHNLHCRIAAAYGYSLAKQEIERLSSKLIAVNNSEANLMDENLRLKEKLEFYFRCYHSFKGDSEKTNKLWEQFKKENNI